jgi:hypothetical protein
MSSDAKSGTEPVGQHKAAKKRKKSPLEIEPMVFESEQYPEIDKERPNMRDYNIPSFPSTSLYIGGTGSGKTSVIATLLTKPAAYGADLSIGLKPFFKPADIHLFGQSMDSDPTWKEVRKRLKIPDSNVYVDTEESDLKAVLDKMQKTAEKHKDKRHCPRSCIVYDDAIGDKEFVMSDNVTRNAIRNRHLCSNVMFSSQSLKRTPRVVRLQAQAICYWAGNATREDQEKVFEEWGSGSMSKKEWFQLIMPHFNKKHTFLYVNRNLPPQTRYRINFEQTILWKAMSVDNPLAEAPAPDPDQEPEPDGPKSAFSTSRSVSPVRSGKKRMK